LGKGGGGGGGNKGDAPGVAGLRGGGEGGGGHLLDPRGAGPGGNKNKFLGGPHHQAGGGEKNIAVLFCTRGAFPGGGGGPTEKKKGGRSQRHLPEGGGGRCTFQGARIRAPKKENRGGPRGGPGWETHRLWGRQGGGGRGEKRGGGESWWGFKGQVALWGVFPAQGGSCRFRPAVFQREAAFLCPHWGGGGPVFCRVNHPGKHSGPLPGLSLRVGGNFFCFQLPGNNFRVVRGAGNPPKPNGAGGGAGGGTFCGGGPPGGGKGAGHPPGGGIGGIWGPPCHGN